MPKLIIGHTTSGSVKIWIRGKAETPFATLRVYNDGEAHEARLHLYEHHLFIRIHQFEGLNASMFYKCRVSFAEEDDVPLEYQHYDNFCQGSFTTFPEEGQQHPLKFLMGSCHLPLFPNTSNRVFRTLYGKARETEANFMLHLGDQIYFDVPKEPAGGPTLENYRDKYLKAWGDDFTKFFLAHLPQYMILDDHEIRNNFANDLEFPRDRTALHYRTSALQAYQEFQHLHNPQTFGSDNFYYAFDFGNYPFFVLDIRTERFSQPRHSQAISDEQMKDFTDWLLTHKDQLKFVVTVVPFITETRFRGDLWSGELFLRQKEQILYFLREHNISQLVFLAGDMHSSGHSTLTLKGKKDIVLHELVSSPLSQLPPGRFWFIFEDNGERDGKYYDLAYNYSFSKDEFYGRHSNAMLVKAEKNHIQYEIFRSKKDGDPELSGSFDCK